MVAVIGMAALALWPHLHLSLLVGEPVFFKNAFDEDTYALFSFLFDVVRLDRLLSGSLLRFLEMASGGSLNFAMTAIDVIAMPLALLAAYWLAAFLFAAPSARLLFAVFLIFSPDLLTLGNASVYPGPYPTLAQFKALFGSAGDVLVPPIETSFLGLARSPEPQVAYVAGFLFVAALLRFVLRRRPEFDWLEIGILTVLWALMVTSYAVVGYPLMAVGGFAAVILAFQKRWNEATLLALMFVGAIGSALLLPRLIVSDGISLVFASRLPTITVSVVLALPLVMATALLLVRRRLADPELWMALAFAGMPIVLTNQQLVSGVMVSTRDWERCITMPLLMIGAALFLHGSGAFAGRADSRAGLALRIGALIVICAVVANASIRSTAWFLRDNLASVAMTRALDGYAPATDAGTIVVLDPPGVAPLVRARMSKPPRILLDYTELFFHPVPRSTGEFVMGANAEALFEFWRQTGVSPQQVDELLNKEAAKRGGYFSGFLFNVCEYWYPCTDSRAVTSARIQRLIPSIIAIYADYRAKPSKTYAGSNFVYLTTVENSVPPAPPYRSQPVAVGRAGNATAYLFSKEEHFD